MTRAARRDPTLRDDIAEIPLTRGLVAIIDAADFPLVVGRNWGASIRPTGVYVTAHYGATLKYLHRVLVGAVRGQLVDHRDYDGLNNRRENLRVATATDSARHRRKQANNSTGFKGVTRNPKTGLWIAAIHAPAKQYLGFAFPSPASAALEYDAAARRLFGDYADLNFTEVGND